MINFGAGPAALPQEVLAQAASAIMNFEGTGISILSLAHRSVAFKSILDEARELCLSLLSLDDSYDVLWFQGGGRLQFELIPMNFLASEATAVYLDSGFWASDALKHALKYGNVDSTFSSKDLNYKRLPQVTTIPSSASYCHLTANNTIYGTQYKQFPKTEVPLIADFSSELLSRNVDYSQFDMIYAVAQKNIGPAGVCMVVVKKSFLERSVREVAPILSYKAMQEAQSLVNTAPVFAIYVSLLNLRHMHQKGLANIELENRIKSKMLYDFIDSSSIYENDIFPADRSLMNVVFNLKKGNLTDLLAYAASQDIIGIEGHRTVGGLRVSLYNAITISEVEKLINMLKNFESEIGIYE